MTDTLVLEADRLFTPAPAEPPLLAVRDGRVVAAGGAARGTGPARRVHGTLAPALVDIQVNGGAGVNLQEPAPDLARLHGWLRRAGVLTYVPTLVSAPLPRMVELARGLAGERDGVRGLAPHFEGPLLSPRRLGAHDRAAVAGARAGELLEATANLASWVTLAPEREGALDIVASLVAGGVRVSAGHSDATFEQARAAFDAGISMVTHLFNAMAPLHHREPGLAGAALDEGATCWAGLIADGEHVHPSMVRTALEVLGERAILVSDAAPAAGDTGGAAPRLGDGTLAGAGVALDQCLRNVIAWGLPPERALHAATAAPAGALGIADRGRLAPELPALVALFDSDWRVLDAGPAEVVGGLIAGVAS